MQLSHSLIGLIILCSIPAISQNRYVSSSGNNTANDCTLPGNPCAGIQYAIDQAADGDSVLIASGTYSEHGLQLSKRLVISGDHTVKPVIYTDTTFAVYINEHHVRLHYLELRLGLTPTSGMIGVFADQRLDSLVLTHNDIFSERPLSTGMVFDAYGVWLYGEPTAKIDLRNNYIGVLSALNDAFGRAVGLGRNISGGDCPGGMIGGSSTADGNECNGFYAFQAIAPANDLQMLFNQWTGTFYMNYVTAGEIVVRGNFISTGGPLYAPFIPALLEIAKSSASSMIRIEENILDQFAYVGLLAGATGNVTITGNEFIPLSSANNFIACMINTKHATAGQDGPPQYTTEADIRGNIFSASSVANSGYALYIGNHNSGYSHPFGDFTIGGNQPQDHNYFDPALEHYIYLDSHTISTVFIPLWSTYFPTVTARVEQDFTALEIHNTYALTGSALEDKLYHQLDHPHLGFITTSLPSFLENYSGQEVRIFPNPARDVVYIPGDGLAGYRIRDMQGREVVPLIPVYVEDVIPVSCSGLLPGVYLVELEYNDRSLKYARLVVGA